MCRIILVLLLSFSSILRGAAFPDPVVTSVVQASPSEIMNGSDILPLKVQCSQLIAQDFGLTCGLIEALLVPDNPEAQVLLARMLDPLLTSLTSERRCLKGHTNWVNAVAFSPDGKRLASGSRDGTVRLWNGKTGQPIQVLKGHTVGVNAVAFSPDGERLASGSNDGIVRLWNGKTGEFIQVLKGYAGSVNAVAFSPDGTLLASGSDRKTVRLRNGKTGEHIQVLEGHTDWVRAVAFNPDETLLASGSDDRTIRLWIDFFGDIMTISDYAEQYLLLKAAADWHNGDAHRVAPEDVAIYTELVKRFSYFKDMRLLTNIIE